MSVRIRLRRMGRKGQPHYRIVVADTAAPRNGRVVETVGYYQPLSRPARLVVNLERVEYWIGQGAGLSDTVNSLLKKARRGGDRSVAIGMPERSERMAMASVRAAAEASTAPPVTDAKRVGEAAALPDGTEPQVSPEAPASSDEGAAAED